MSLLRELLCALLPHTQMCPIIFQPSQLNLAASFYILLWRDGGLPINVYGDVINPLIADLNRSSPGLIDNGRVLTYTNWVPSVLLPRAWYTVSVKSPSNGPDARTGFTSLFNLQVPYVWVAGAWGSCFMPAACGGGWQYRDVSETLCGVRCCAAAASAAYLAWLQVYCHDNRTTAYRDESIPSNFTIPYTDWRGSVIQLDVYLVDNDLCGSYTPRPRDKQRYPS